MVRPLVRAAASLMGLGKAPTIRLSVTANESATEGEASLADEPEVRQALAEADRASVASVVAGHPSSPLAWAELADLADSEGHAMDAFAYAAVAVDFAREQLTASGWEPGAAVPWSDEPNRAYLRALDAQRRAALALGLDDQAARLAEELASADAEAPARIASEFTPTQLMPIVASAAPLRAGHRHSSRTPASRSPNPPPSTRQERTDMPAAVLIGAQWGDEGKGKATDLLGSRLDYVVKFNGGNNAGHTVVVGEEKYALHLLPSGILTPGVTPVIGNGVVVDVEVLFEELEGLESRGVDVSKLRVSANAHLITQYHRTLDKVTERFLGKRQIGTTGRGIGPAYADKINRVGLRMQDLFDENILRQKVEGALDQKNHLLVKVYNRRAIGVDEVVEELLGYVDRLRPMVTDTSLLLHQALERGETVLFEGGQATMLDVDHGTYPFVTSSNATSGGAVTGSGIAPNRIDRVIAVVKAYTTRVGAGPFPTELFDEWGDFLTERGFEFGTTTGRRRRTGWYDAPIARYASRINGVTDFVLTKLDVLTGLERIPVAVAYEVDGQRFDEVPVSQSDFHHAVPVYEEFPGWSEDISGAREFSELPANAQATCASSRR